MFGFLKKKIADFGNKLKETVSGKAKEEQTHAEADSKTEKEVTTVAVMTTQPEATQQIVQETPAEKKEEIKIEQQESIEKPAEPQKPRTREEKAAEIEKKLFAEIEEEIKKEDTAKVGEVKAPVEQKPTPPAIEEKPLPVLEEKKEIKQELAPQPQALPPKPVKPKAKEVARPLEEEFFEDEKEEVTQKVEEKTEQVTIEKPRDIQIKTVQEDKRELKAKVGIGGKIKGFLFGGIEVTEKEISELLYDLELSLLESDVEQDAAYELVKKIKEKLLGTKASSKNLDEFLKDKIKEALKEMMQTQRIDLLTETKKHSPLKILMLGPNGAGKTTSIAKLVNYFQKNKKTCVVAAADTFRAGAIHQLEEHANKLGVRVIKQQYGADPAAVAFDAVKAAEAGKIDVVIIDSAGRQETNKNLMEELRKIERVAKPDIKIYVGEAYIGQTLLEQVEEFQQIAGIDGFILTKIDTDAKGGTAISLLYRTKKPILFVGTGQGYDDFKEFTPEFILERIL